MNELNCLNCCIGDFKYELCDCDGEFCKRYKSIGRSEDFIKAVLADTPHSVWIECGENKDGTHNIMCAKCGGVVVKHDQMTAPPVQCPFCRRGMSDKQQKGE